MQLATEVLLGVLVVGLVWTEVVDYRLPDWFCLAIALVSAAAAVATASLPAALVASVFAVLLVRAVRRRPVAPPEPPERADDTTP